MIAAVTGFDWDDANRDKCCKHGLTTADIEHVLAHAETLIVPDEKNSEFEPRFIAIGRTEANRYAFVGVHPTRTGIRPGASTDQRSVHAPEGDREICERNFPS